MASTANSSKSGKPVNAAKATKAAKAEPKPAAPKPTVRRAAPKAAKLPDDLSGRAAHSTLAATPLIGIRSADLKRAAGIFAGAMLKQPRKVASHLGSYARELGRVAAGTSEARGDPKDRRFADPAWQSSPVHQRLLQVYLATGKGLNQFIDDTNLDAKDKERARFLVSLIVDGIAPSNTLLNPAALKKIVDTGGKSLVAGIKNLVHDIRENRGMPSMVDRTPFKIGENIAIAPGAVVFKNDVLELIQYAPSTDKVYRRPVVYVSPQINKFYAIDLTPDKSLVKWAVDSGVQLFVVSWRNPTIENRDWGLDTYVAALHEAVAAAQQITGSVDVNMFGSCSGGMTMSAYLGWLAAGGDLRVKSATFCVCVLDMGRIEDSTAGLFLSPASVKAIKAAVNKRGLVSGSEMATMFAWLRANDLVWNYVVNNYLLGNKPPAFDILFWNADATRLPAKFHADLLDLFDANPFVNAGRLSVLGTPIDLSQVKVEAYVLGGVTDHITPWPGCYQTARLYGPKSTFVLANSGHLQSLINAPGNPKAWFVSNPASVESEKDWASTAVRVEGSWWPHWRAWIQTRSGEQVAAPRKLGSRKHKPGSRAPGDYIFED